MDHLTWVLNLNRQAAPQETPWPEEDRRVLWRFPAEDRAHAPAEAAHGTAPLRWVSAAGDPMPDEALETALETAERAAERLTRQGAGSLRLPADRTSWGGPFDLPTPSADPVGTGTFGSLSPAVGPDTGSASGLTMEEISRYFERDARRYG